METKDKVVTLRLEPSTWKRLLRLSHEVETTPTQIIRDYLNQALDLSDGNIKDLIGYRDACTEIQKLQRQLEVFGTKLDTLEHSIIEREST